jgi:chorismate mutase
MTVLCRGVRGATTAEANTQEAITEATRELLSCLVVKNDLAPKDIASAVFSTTPDLDAAFPALAARELGWNEVALFGCQEMAVPGAPPRCIRVLIHWNTPKTQAEIRHVYLKGACSLRPDRVPG